MIACRACRSGVRTGTRDGVYMCRCTAVSVRVSGPVMTVNEFTKGALLITNWGNNGKDSRFVSNETRTPRTAA